MASLCLSRPGIFFTVGRRLLSERGQATMAGQTLTFDHRVTNVYRREAGGWKIVHHHADISPEMQELLNRLHSQQRQTTT